MKTVLKPYVTPAPDPSPETPMDRTTRAVQERLHGEAEKRHAKMARLRKARLEREANTPAVISIPKSKSFRKLGS